MPAEPGRTRAVGWIVGLVLTVVPVAAALAGPLLAPYSPTASVGPPLAGPGTGLLGTDVLGRDVLSRVLHGGLPTVTVGVGAAVLAELVAVALGLLIAWRRRRLAGAVLRAMDVVFAVPTVLVLAVIAVGVGVGVLATFVAVVVLLTPPGTRVVYLASRALLAEPYVESAVLRGERAPVVAAREVLPNLVPVVLADLGLRVLDAVFIVTAAGFLGFGPQPPTADWGQMINENAVGIARAPLAVLAPVAAILALTVGVNLLGDRLVARGRNSRSATRPAEPARV